MLPKRVLFDVAWSCRPERYEDREGFGKKVQGYQDAIKFDRHAWRPDEIAIDAPAVVVSFRAWDAAGESQVLVNLTLHADETSFSQLELFHKLCDGIGEKLLTDDLHLYDHCFFEGLTLNEESSSYWIYFGS